MDKMVFNSKSKFTKSVEINQNKSITLKEYLKRNLDEVFEGISKYRSKKL